MLFFCENVGVLAWCFGWCFRLVCVVCLLVFVDVVFFVAFCWCVCVLLFCVFSLVSLLVCLLVMVFGGLGFPSKTLKSQAKVSL